MQYWMRKIHFMIGNRTLTYISTESEFEIQKYKLQENNTKAKKSRKDTNEVHEETKSEESNNSNKEEFEAMKNKMKKTIIGTIIGVVLAVIGAVAYKYFRG